MYRTNSIVDGVISVYANASLYTKDAIFKCLYWFGDKFHTIVSFADENTYLIVLNPLSNVDIPKEELELYMQKLERDLIDFQLRDTITKETQNVRDLLIAKAFSSGEFDEDPPGDVSDPLGFNPSLIVPND